MEDWYRLTTQMVLENGGASLLFHHSGSPQAALKFAFPEHKWQPWLFENRAKNLFDDQNILKEYIESIGQSLHVNDLTDWCAERPESKTNKQTQKKKEKQKEKQKQKEKEKEKEKQKKNKRKTKEKQKKNKRKTKEKQKKNKRKTKEKQKKNKRKTK